CGPTGKPATRVHPIAAPRERNHVMPGEGAASTAPPNPALQVMDAVPSPAMTWRDRCAAPNDSFNCPRALAFRFVRVGFHLDIRTDGVGVVLQIGRVLQDVLFGLFFNAFHLDVGLLQAGGRNRLLGTPLFGDVAAGAARTRLVERLFGRAFRTDRGDLGQVVETGAAGDADTLGAEFRL